MRRAARLLPALAALFFLGACATPVASAAAGDPADDYSWSMHADGNAAHLMFGVPDSDIVWFGMSCRTGSGRVQLTQYGSDSKADPRLLLASGGARQAIGVTREPNELHEETATAELKTSEPVLAAFRSTGRLGVTGAAADGYSAATSAERAEIARFFAACSV